MTANTQTGPVSAPCPTWYNREMDYREQLSVYRRYYELVQQDKADALTCGVCEAIMLYYVDYVDRVYLKCLGCDRKVYPGTAEIKALKEQVDEGSYLG